MVLRNDIALQLSRSRFALGSCALFAVAGCSTPDSISAVDPANTGSIADASLSDLMNKAGLLAVERPSGLITFSPFLKALQDLEWVG